MGGLKVFLSALTLILVFSLGILSYPVFEEFDFETAGINYPTGASTVVAEKDSPGDWTNERDFTITEDGLLYKNKDIFLAKFAPTKSMDPTFDEGTIGIQLKITDNKIKEKIKKGDIIVYKDPLSGEKIVHRVLEKVANNDGETCFLTGGDNAVRDPYLVCDPEKVMIGLFY